jgi:hypothetical protein
METMEYDQAGFEAALNADDVVRGLGARRRAQGAAAASARWALRRVLRAQQRRSAHWARMSHHVPLPQDGYVDADEGEDEASPQAPDHLEQFIDLRKNAACQAEIYKRMMGALPRVEAHLRRRRRVRHRGRPWPARAARVYCVGRRLLFPDTRRLMPQTPARPSRATFLACSRTRSRCLTTVWPPPFPSTPTPGCAPAARNAALRAAARAGGARRV